MPVAKLPLVYRGPGAMRKAFKENAILLVKTDGLISLSTGAELGTQAVAWQSFLHPCSSSPQSH